MPVHAWCHRLLLCFIVLPCLGCDDADDASMLSGDQSASGGETIVSVNDDPALEGQVRAFCGDCHVMPRPESFAKAAWYDEVRRGFDFYFQSGRQDLDPPPQAKVVEYFRSRAPETIADAKWENATSSRIEFVAHEVTWEVGSTDRPAISFLELDASASSRPQVFWSEMRSGQVASGTLDGEFAWTTDVVPHPCAVRRVDLNGNEVPDLLVTDLGSFLPEDHDNGKLVWVPDGDPAGAVTVLEDVGRVSDVRGGDFDDDGDIDLIVAVFGWHETGGIHLLNNEPGDDGVPRFTIQIVDERPGTIHVPTIDLNDDRRLDFVALISQEHETITAFINEEGGFRKVELFNAPDPAYGSSGIDLVDLDLDGDQDVLYTNGDTFDSYDVKPYHGISWLENQGDLTFFEHRLTTMPGVHRALADDLDLDGDLDIAAVALLPARTLAEHDANEFDSVIWLEQTLPGTFARRSVERGRLEHATLALGDLDGDEDIDLVAGAFLDPSSESRHVVTVFWNQLRRAAPMDTTSVTAE